jgi:hypothetical protein
MSVFGNRSRALRPECLYFAKPPVQLASEEAVGAVFSGAELLCETSR